MLIKKPEHPVGAVPVCVGMHAPLDKMILATKVGSDIAPVSHRMKWLWHFVTQHHEWFNRDLVGVAQAVFILHRKIAIDATPNLIALGTYLYRLRYFDHAVGEHPDVAVEAQDTLVGNCCCRK